MGESAFSNLAYAYVLNSGEIGGLSITRLMGLNLIYRIKEYCLPLNGYVGQYTETLNPGSFIQNPNNINLQVTPYALTFKDLVYFNPDPSNIALTGILTTPTLSTTNGLSYTDYANGIVYFSGQQTQQLTATYNYYSVGVQEGFPDWGFDLKRLEELNVPLISVSWFDEDPRGFTVGGAYQEDRRFKINILGASEAMMQDLTSILSEFLRGIITNTINYSFGFPLDFNGDKNVNFDRGIASQWFRVRLMPPKPRSIHTPNTMPEKLRHQAEIMLTTRID